MSEGKRGRLCESEFHFYVLFFHLRLLFYSIAECNNALIYPGLGFGAILSRSRCVTDTMLVAGANRLAELSPLLGAVKESKSGDEEQNRDDENEYIGAGILPDIEIAAGVNFEVGIAVAEQAVREGSASDELRIEEVREKAREKVWVPVYTHYIHDEFISVDEALNVETMFV